MPKPIVITGAAGFIGRNVVAALNARNQDNLLLVDSLGETEKWRNLVGLRYEDILSPKDFLAKMNEQMAAQVDSVIHVGACSSTTEKNADYLLENNYHYTRTLCQACHAAGTRFVYASSAAT
jgi:ADP-L-glycero-D-manno-heptose 6-epimerase